MKNVLTVSSIAKTLCPHELHKTLSSTTYVITPTIAEVDSKRILKDDEEKGTVRHAYIAHMLLHPYSTYKFKFKNIASEAREYVNWAKENNLVRDDMQVEATFKTIFEDEYLPGAVLIGRPDLVTKNKFGRLTIVDWKAPDAIITPEFHRQRIIYAVQVMVANGKFEDADLINFNGHMCLQHITAQEAEALYDTLSDVCTAAVADCSPLKPTSKCQTCCNCESIQNFITAWNRHFADDPIRLGKYWAGTETMHKQKASLVKTAAIEGKIPTATVATTYAYQSSAEAVALMEERNPEGVTVKKTVLAENARKYFTPAEFDQFKTGKKIEVTYNNSVF